MKTTITYNVPDEQLDGILAMLGYTEGSKEDFMNNAITNIVIPAISDVFINIRQKKAQEEVALIPSYVHSQVESMISITTI